MRMTGFTALRDISNIFYNDLRQISSELFTANTDNSFEDVISKKLRDITLLTSKLHLLRAKPLASTPQITKEDKNNTLNNYEETATWAIIEQQTVRSFTQTCAVKSLLVANNNSLSPEMRERKLKIKEQLIKYGQLEKQLCHLNAVVKEKQNKHALVQAQWDSELGMLRHIRASAMDTTEIDYEGPLYQKLCTLVDKMELMRWIMSKLVTARKEGYDWLADPHKRYSCLKLSREVNTVENLLQD